MVFRKFLLVFLAVALGMSVAAQAATWRCRVGVAGDFAAGYAGLLARHGIPHEFVMDQQLRDDKFLERYDALILGSLSMSRLPETAAPLERYVRRGGRLLFGSTYSLTPFQRSDHLEGEQPLLEWYCAQSPRARRGAGTVVPASDNGPLAPEWTSAHPFSSLVVQNRVAFNFPQMEVLAKYTALSIPDSERKKSLPEAKAGEAAIVKVPRGKGYYVLSGPALGVGMGLYGVYADALVLSLVRMMTDGRGVPQLTAEGVHLSRGKSVEDTEGNDKEAQPDEAPPGETQAPAPVRPVAPGKQSALPADFEPLTDAPEPEFAVFGSYVPGAGDALLVSNYANDVYHYAVEFTSTRVSLVSVERGRRRALGRAPVDRGAAKIPFVLKERGDKLSLFLPGEARLQVQTDRLWKGLVGVRGEALTDCRLQPLAPIYFSDDFMRTADRKGDWETITGTWKINSERKPETSANPFTFVAVPAPQALAVAGYGFWDTYRVRADVRPGAAGGAVGMVCYYRDENNYWLFRAQVNDTPTAIRDGFELVRMTNGEPEVIKKGPGALVRGQWYRLSLRAIDKWIGAFVDGKKVLTVADTMFSGGKIGLWAEGGPATFDDVSATSALSQEEPPEVFRGLVPGYAGVIDQDTWAGPASEWAADPNQRGVFWNQGLFFGNAGVQFRGTVLAREGVSLSLFFMPDRSVTRAGYRLDAVRVGPRVHFRLSCRGKQRETDLPTTADPPLFSLRREGDHVIARVNGQDRLQLPGPGRTTTPWRLGFWTGGAKPRLSDITYWSDHTYNDTFQSAPHNWWVGRGEWTHTNRWSCSPEWSWYGGVSPIEGNQYAGPAVVWSKYAFTGSQCLEFYTGPKMLPKPKGRGTLEQMRDFNATLCGDGKDVRSGYTFLVAPAGKNVAQILRQGQVVTETTNFYVPQAAHNRWLHLTAARLGNEITLEFDGQPLLHYHDPDPLPGGYVALWTEANGIVIPRVTLYYAGREGSPLSLALAPVPVDEHAGDDLGKTLTFDEAVDDWYSLDDQATLTVDTKTFKDGPGALSYTYTPREGAFAVLLSPALKVAGAKTLTVDIRCSRSNEVVFTLMEADHSRYIYLTKLPAGRWTHLSLPLSRFHLTPDSYDENGRLDAEELQTFTVTDMDAVNVWQGRQKEAPERTVWLDNLNFS